MLVIPEDNRILYFARDRASFRFLSHFWPSPIVLDGEEWPTVEHYYQAQKSLNPTYRNAVRSADTPRKAKDLSVAPDAPRRLSHSSWFLAHDAWPRPDWETIKVEIMRNADEAKFRQNSDLAALLLATADAELIEDSPADSFWGTGNNGQGLNWAGRVLMEVRERLRGG